MKQSIVLFRQKLLHPPEDSAGFPLHSPSICVTSLSDTPDKFRCQRPLTPVRTLHPDHGAKRRHGPEDQPEYNCPHHKIEHHCKYLFRSSISRQKCTFDRVIYQIRRYIGKVCRRQHKKEHRSRDLKRHPKDLHLTDIQPLDAGQQERRRCCQQRHHLQCILICRRIGEIIEAQFHRALHLTVCIQVCLCHSIDDADI